MDLASVVAALASVGVRVSGSTPNNNIQGDSSRACPTGLAGPEPSGTHNDPGQLFHPGGPPGDPDDPPGDGDPDATRRWIVYLRRKVQILEREVDTGKGEMTRIARVPARAQRELDIAKIETPPRSCWTSPGARPGR